MNYEQNHMEEEKLIEKIIETKRVAKVVKGGRNFSFSAIVVVGDKPVSYTHLTLPTIYSV